jgi:amidase
MSDELAMSDASAQAELVRRGEMTAPEPVQAAIERIERLNAKSRRNFLPERAS